MIRPSDIRTVYEPPYGRCAGFWQAYDADRYDGAEDAGPQAVDWGRTEAEAIADLKFQIEEMQ